MIKERRCWMIICDRCGVEKSTPEFKKELARFMARKKSGFSRMNEKDYCPECAKAQMEYEREVIENKLDKIATEQIELI